MTERVTLKPGDYVRTEGMTEDEYHAVARAFIEAGCPRREYPDVSQMRDMKLFGWASSVDSPNKGLWHSANKVYHAKGRHLTIDQVLTATNAGGKAKDTLTTILESAAEHDAKAKHHAEECERLMQQARDMLPDGWRLVRAEDMVNAVSEDPRDWIKGSIAPTQDMSDPANWREGDVVTCMKTDRDHAGDFEYGHTYTVNKPVTDFGWVSCIVSGAETNSLPADHFRFHHRPNT